MKPYRPQSVPEKAVLDEMTETAEALVAREFYQQGYPFDQDVNLAGYYKWLCDTGLCRLTLINVGDPYKTSWDMLDTDKYERRVVDFMAEAFGFDVQNHLHWGVLANGGTDGNQHGLYFGRKYLEDVAQQMGLDEAHAKPILYVSREAHYSVLKLADILQLETCPIDAHPMGQMDVEDLRRKLDPTRPALIVIAIGGTFKGAIDDQEAIAQVINEKQPPCVYRHLDAALFGGYLPWAEDPVARQIINQQERRFDSIAVSGHKFPAMNEPVGIFICRREVLDHLHTRTVAYLNTLIPTISCSRSGFDCLKLYWRIMTTGPEGFRKETRHVMEMTRLLKAKLEAAGVETYVNPYSTTVLMKRPADWVVHKYAMACSSYEGFGELSHVVVMQFFNEAIIDELVKDIVSK